MAKDERGSDRLELETHIDAAAAKAHALELACDEEMFKSIDDGAAIMALIRRVADHTAHARGLYEQTTSSRGDDGISIVTC